MSSDDDILDFLLHEESAPAPHLPPTSADPGAMSDTSRAARRRVRDELLLAALARLLANRPR